MSTKLVLVVAAAIYDKQGRILLAQRPEGKSMAGLWELPGGKIEPGETPEVALARELREELDILVNPSLLKPITFASHTYHAFHLLMPIYEVKHWDGEVRPQEQQGIAWVSPEALSEYPAPEADIPLFQTLLARHRSGTHGSDR